MIKTKIIVIIKSVFILLLVETIINGCASYAAVQNINENPEQKMRGDSENTSRVINYLSLILMEQDNREIRAYHRRAYNPDNKKTLFLYHCFYGFFHEGNLEHTLVFTATPKGSVVNGNWMLDATSDLESLQLFIDGDNPWEVKEFVDKKGNSTLHFENTVKKILSRVEAGYSFFGPASVRTFPWYHWIWLSLTPPPIISLGTVLVMSINSDNCVSAVIETMQWN